MNRLRIVIIATSVVSAIVATPSLFAQDPSLVTAKAATSTTTYWADRWRGWHFYEEPVPEQPPQRETARAQVPQAASAPSARVPELEEFTRLQKRMEDLRNIAIMRPTETNVRRYMELEAKVVEQASAFADMAKRVAWATPELDPSTQGRPVNAKALEVYEETQRVERSRSVSQLARDHVLFFFFRSDCPYCHAFAPILAAFQDRYGIQVVPVSLDGGTLPGFPSARRDNGIATTLQVTQVPAVYLAQPFTGQITPIGFGVLSESQLLERISIVGSPDGQAMLPSATRQIAMP